MLKTKARFTQWCHQPLLRILSPSWTKNLHFNRNYSTKSCNFSTSTANSTREDPYLFFLNFDKNGKQLPKDEYLKQMKHMNNPFQQYEGIPTFFLHGLLGSGQNYVSIMNKYSDVLATNGSCLLLDSRNHGRSSHTTTMSYDDLSDDIITVMDELKLEKVNIVAHSMSGKALMNLLLRESLNSISSPLLQRINKAIVVDVSPVDYTKDDRWVIKQYIDAMRGINLKTLKTRTEAEAILAKVGGISRDARLFLLTNLVRLKEDNNNDTAGWAWRCNLDVIEAYLPQIGSFPFKTREDALGMYQVPVQYLGDNILFLRGAKSMYVTDHYEIISKTFFPNATFNTVKNASHWIHIDNPHEFTTLISEFVNT
ncbi:hypothetical protein C9374_000654 [Naegleria lovaniensis]|uniref:AB hydrolase-1 domain-containing protein n=1 Tax=Naegleria lovaniensis TaxID=51637 RepID=A0AA88GTB8_NAELO|nr:uncharacterized protein C9374_000654 [Naegleria lovaniensis]KAG2388490.1 hypothetical protein C9374_000654 [Naegleria lovaniensis]